MKTILAIALVSFSAMSAACTAATVDPSAPSSSDDALSAAKKLKVVGTFVNEGDDADSLIFYAFTFRSDGTYSAQGGCKPGPDGDHCFAIVDAQGTYVMAKSGPELGAPQGGIPQLVLTDSFQQETKYFVSVDGDKLSLTTTFNGDASVFTQTAVAKAPGDAKVVGDFGNDGTDNDALPFFGFTFNADGTYLATGGCRPNPTGPSCFAIMHQSGTWATITGGPQLGAPQGVPELLLTDATGDDTKYFYTVDGKTLSLSTTFNGETSVFTKH